MEIFIGPLGVVGAELISGQRPVHDIRQPTESTDRRLFLWHFWFCISVHLCNFMSTNLFIHSGYFNSASSSPLLGRQSTDTVSEFHRQLRVKDLPKVPTWRLERDSNPRPLERNASNLPMSQPPRPQ